jgi:hypothetical protein
MACELDWAETRRQHAANKKTVASARDDFLVERKNGLNLQCKVARRF